MMMLMLIVSSYDVLVMLICLHLKVNALDVTMTYPQTKILNNKRVVLNAWEECHNNNSVDS